MKRFCAALGMSMLLGSGVWAQVNGPGPAELPPAGYEGREYVDSRGCVFMRSTFGGEVTWVPRYGPDRQIVCDQSPTSLQAADTDPAQERDVAGPAAPAPASARVEPVPQPVRAVPAPARTTPQRTARAPQRRALPQADATGRHPACPASSPYGQLVDTELGRPLVRCVTSPALFLDQYVNGAAHVAGHGPIALPQGYQTQAAPRSQPRATGTGRMVQVGSFAVQSNATRLRARLQSAGMPVRLYQSRGLTVVSVGPFSNGGQTQSALAQVRRMGFHDAFMR